MCVRALVQGCVCVCARVCVSVQPVWVKITIYILMVLGIAQLLVEFYEIQILKKIYIKKLFMKMSLVEK